MGLFTTNFKEELQELITKIESKDFQLPENWVWWNKRESALLAIEEADITIIKEIKKLYKKGHLNRKLTSEILRLAIDLRDEIERMRKKPDLEHQAQRAQHINGLIAELDAFLNEELTIETLGIETHNLILYHGSATPNLTSFKVAEEDTIGRGIYLTDKKSAEGYAKYRAQSRKGTPIIYEFRLHNLWLADLRNDHKVGVCFAKYEHRLREIMERPGIVWYWRRALERSLELLKSGKLRSGNLKSVTFSNTSEFSRFLEEHGYDGLVDWEGGEGTIGRHLSYVIFDPSKIKLLKEIPVIKI